MRIWISLITLSLFATAAAFVFHLSQDAPQSESMRPESVAVNRSVNRDAAGGPSKKEIKAGRKAYFKERFGISHEAWAQNRAAKRLEADTPAPTNRRGVPVPVFETVARADFSGGSVTGYWIERGSNNQAGRMHTTAIDYETQKIYAASDGGNVWLAEYTIDAGTNEMIVDDWQCINDGANNRINEIRSLHVVTTDTGAKRVLATQTRPAAVFYTDNDGLDWQTSSGISEPFIRRMIVQEHPTEGTRLYAVGKGLYEDGLVYFSDDFGETFSTIATYPRDPSLPFGVWYLDIWASGNGSNAVIVLFNDQLYSIDQFNNSTPMGSVPIDFPITFTDLDARNLPSVSSAVHLVGCGPETSETLYAVYPLQDQKDSDIYYSRVWRYADDDGDGVRTWAETASSVADCPFDTNSVACLTSDPDTVFLGASGAGVRITRDGGDSWSSSTFGDYYRHPESALHADLPGIDVIPYDGPDWDADALIFVSTDGGLYISHDDLSSVRNISMSGLGVSQYYDTYTSTLNPEVIFAGSQDQGLQRSLAGVFDFEHIYDFDQIWSGDQGSLASGDGGASLWAVYIDSLIAYFPNAMTSDSNRSIAFPNKADGWFPPVVADPFNPKVAYVGLPSSTDGKYEIVKVEATGSSYISLSTSSFSHLFDDEILDMEISSADPAYWYVATTGGFFTSTSVDSNGEPVWIRSGSSVLPSPLRGKKIVSSPQDPQTVYLSSLNYSSGGVFVSHNAGADFNVLTDRASTPREMNDLAVSDDGALLFATAVDGPYMYNLNGPLYAWESIADATAPDQAYTSVEYVPELNTARYGTYGRGIWDFFIEKETFIVTPERFAEGARIVYFAPVAYDGVDARFELYHIHDDETTELVETFAHTSYYGMNRIDQPEWDSLPMGSYELRMLHDGDTIDHTQLFRFVKDYFYNQDGLTVRMTPDDNPTDTVIHTTITVEKSGSPLEAADLSPLAIDYYFFDDDKTIDTLQAIVDGPTDVSLEALSETLEWDGLKADKKARITFDEGTLLAGSDSIVIELTITAAGAAFDETDDWSHFVEADGTASHINVRSLQDGVLIWGVVFDAVDRVVTATLSSDELLLFGAEIGKTTMRKFSIKNNGNFPNKIHAIEIDNPLFEVTAITIDGEDFPYEEIRDNLYIQPGQSIWPNIVYSPEVEEEVTANLVIESDVEDASLLLRGTGFYGYLLLVTPNPITTESAITYLLREDTYVNSEAEFRIWSNAANETVEIIYHTPTEQGPQSIPAPQLAALDPGNYAVTLWWDDGTRASSTDFDRLLGDVNADGAVTIVDALLTAQYYVDLISDIHLKVADVNCDGEATIVDALLMAQYYVGLITRFPCEQP